MKMSLEAPTPIWSEILGKNVKRARMGMKLTQQLLSERSDVDLSYLGKLERGLCNPTLSVIVRIAHALTLSPAALLEVSETDTIAR